jgi:cytochrome c biogenesis protein CcmG, thiol:disulfide interchange protein DsbE
MRGWKIILVSVASAALLIVLFLGFGRDPHAVPFALKGKPAPDFKLTPILGGEPIGLAALKGKPIVMNFWATWCVPCKYEHPILEEAHRQFQSDAHFLGVLFEDTPERAKTFLAQNRSSYAQLVDPLSRTAVDYGIAGVPETYFIDKNGIIVYKHVGPVDFETFNKQMRALLQ